MGKLRRLHLLHGAVAVAVVAIDDLAAAPAAAVLITHAADIVVTCTLVTRAFARRVVEAGTDVSADVVTTNVPAVGADAAALAGMMVLVRTVVADATDAVGCVAIIGIAAAADAVAAAVVTAATVHQMVAAGGRWSCCSHDGLRQGPLLLLLLLLLPLLLLLLMLV